MWITSYDLLKRDIELYQDIVFANEIIDEAQYIKNQTTHAAKSVRLVNSSIRMALTGTPMEEIPEECILWLFNPDADGDGKLDYNVIYNEEGQEGFAEADLYYMQ